MFKKILSVLLCAVLILSTIIGTVTANDDAVLNLDFENYPSGGALNKFKIADTGDTAYGKALYGNFTAADANASPAAAIFTSGAVSKLQKGVEYEISLSYKAIELNSTFTLHLFYADNANSYVRKKIPGSTSNTPAATSPYLVRFAHNGNGETPRNEWLTATVTFTPEYDAYVYLSLWTNAAAEFYIDNVVISKKGATPPPEPVDPNLVVDWDFENYSSGGALNKFKIADTGDTAQGKALYGNFTAADANASPAAALMTSTSDAKVETGATYEVSLKYKAVNLNSTFALHLFYADNANSYVRKKIPGTTSNTPAAVSPYLVRFAHNGAEATVKNQWITLTASFTAEYDAYLYLGLWTNAVTEFYIDDFKIIKVKAVEIKFNTNGGTEIEPLSGSAGSNLSSFPTPQKEGFSFAGWYNDEALTTPFTSTVFPENDITLYAKWVDEGVYEQTFEGYTVSGSLATNTLSVYTKQSETDPFVHSGSKSLYKPAVKNSYFLSAFPYSTQKLKAGKGYKLTMWVYAPQKVEKENEGAWQLTLLDSKDNAFSVGDRKKLNIKYFNSTFKEGEWQQLELIFTPSADGFMGLYAYGAFEMYIDDISLVEVNTVTVNFETLDGNPMESLSGAAGQIVSTVPTPTHPEEKAFAGWFTDAEYTKKYNFKTLPQNDLTVYAKWITKGSFEQTFEDYYYENDTANGTYTKATLSVYHATSDNDTNVHSGKSSMRYYQKLLPEAKVYGFSIFDPTMGQLEIGEKYYVSYWMKPVEISNTFYHAVYSNSVVDNAFANYNMHGYFTTHADVIGKTGDVSEYFFGPAGKYFVSEPDENGWIKFTFEATATDKYFSIYLDWDAEVYIDDVAIEPLPTGVVNNDYNKPVCEPLYDEIHSTYPAASTTRSNEVQIYKLELNPRGDYVFSADIRPNTMGVYAALSFDGVNIIEGTKITFNSAKRVMLDKSGVVYLHVYNPIGESIFGRLQLFNTRAGKEKISNYVDVPQNTEIPELSELLKQKEYSEILADAIFDDDSASFEDDFDYNSPQTGDSTSLALVSIILCLATAFIVLTKKKGGHKYE